MTGTGPTELERHLRLNPHRFDRDPKVKAAIQDCVDQMRCRSDPMEIHEMAHQCEDEYDCEREGVHAVGQGKRQEQRERKGKGWQGRLEGVRKPRSSQEQG